MSAITAGFTMWLSRPTTQAWLIQKATKVLSEKLKTDVHIEKVNAHLFQSLVLENVLVKDKKNDTLIFVHQLMVKLTDVFFLKKNTTLSYIKLDGVKLNAIQSLTDTAFNYQFILDELATPSSGNNSIAWKFNFKTIDLRNITIAYNHQQKEILYANFKKLKLNIDELNLNKKILNIKSLLLVEPTISYSKTENTTTSNSIQSTSNKKDSTAESLSWKVFATNLKIENGNLTYCIQKKDSTHVAPNQFNANDFKMDEINLDAPEINFTKTEFEAQLNEISLREKCGLKAFASTDVRFAENVLQLKNLRLKTPYSHIDESIEIDFGRNKKIDLANISFKTKIKTSFLHPDDIAHFVATPSWLQPIELIGELKGKLNNLRSKEVELTMGNTAFKGNFSIKGLPDLKNTFIDFNAKQLTSNGAELANYFPKTQHPEILQRLGDIFFSGSFNGFMNDFVAQGQLKTSLGDANSDVNMKISDDGKLSYSGSIAAIQFDLGKLSGQDSLFGKISISANVNGKGWLNQNPEVHIQGSLQQFQFNNYSYKNISLDGLLKQNQFDGAITSTDPNLNFDFNGSVNLNDSLPHFNFNSTVRSVDLQKLNFATDEFCIANAIIKINAVGNNIDNFSGIASIDNFQFNTKHKNHWLKQITLSSSIKNETKNLKLNSDVLNLIVDGKFNYSELPGVFQSYLNQYFPAYVEANKNKNLSVQNFTFECKINDKENLINDFIPNLILKGENKIVGSFSTKNSNLKLKATLDDFEWNGKKIAPVTVLLQSNADKLFGDVTANKLSITDSFIIHDSKLHFIAQHDSLNFNYSMAGDTALFAFNINGLSTMHPEHITTHLSQSDIFIKGYHWFLQKSNEINFTHGYFDLKDVEWNSGEQNISINSMVENEHHDNLKIDFSKVKLEELMTIIGAKDADLSGILNASSLIKNYNADAIIESKIDFKNCMVGKNLLGDIAGVVSYRNSIKKLFSEVEIQQNSNSMTVSGYYNLNDTLNSLNYSMALKNFNINTIEPLINNILSHKHGNLSGTASLFGNPKHPKIAADVYLKDGGMSVNYLNTHYDFDDVHAICKNNIILFDKFNIRDSFNNKAAFTGNIDLNNMHRVLLDLHIDAPKLFVMNTDMNQNNIFFGKAYASGTIDITGITYNLTIAAKAKTLKGTSVNIPITDDRDVSKHDFIQFENNNTDSIKNKKDYVVDLDGITLKFDIETTPDAEVNILMDLVSGDYIKARGSGNVKVEFSSNKAFGMYGNYTMERGEYYFTLFNIPKNFNVNNGSTITWDGDAYNGTLDVVGTYVTRAAFSDLIADLAKTQPDEYAKAKNKVPVQVKMMLKGSLKKPDIAFDISPSDNSSTAINFTALQRLQAIKVDQNELNNQVFALLAMNSFITPQNVGGFDNALAYNSTYKQSATDLASTQVTRLLNNAFYNITKNTTTQLNVNYRLYDQNSNIESGSIAQSQRNLSQFNVSITKRFLNDRLVLDVGGVYDYGAVSVNNTNGLFGDFNIEYNLTADGTVRIRGFRKTEYDVLYERNRNRTGIGLAYKKEFNRLGELFLRDKKKASIKEPK